MSAIKLEVDGKVVYESTASSAITSTTPSVSNSQSEYTISPFQTINKKYYYKNQNGEYVEGVLTRKIPIDQYTDDYMMDNNYQTDQLYVLKSGGGAKRQKIPKTKTPRQKIAQKSSTLNYLYLIEINNLILMSMYETLLHTSRH